MKVVFTIGCALSFVGAALAACGPSSNQPGDAGDAGTEAEAATPPPLVTITATVASTSFVTREHFLASGEMQISGEPFAEAMGRVLANYSRDHVPSDLYFDTSPSSQGPWIDLPGFSTAVESYEYSKQAMNDVAFESGAGTSLVYGPVVNAGGATGAAATSVLAARVQHFGESSNALAKFVFPAGTFPVNPNMLLGVRGSGDANPLGKGTGAENPLGWPGIWPTVHVFRKFDPTIDPTGTGDLYCAISSDDDPGTTGALVSSDYECDATTLHLRDRTSQIDPTITPGGDGFSAWKYGLWVLNYLQVMHDTTEAPVTTVAAADLANVGTPNNTIVGADDTGAPTAAGTYLGSSDIEGFQAQMFIQEMDDRAQDWISSLTTVDGATLSGFATIKDAEAYDYQAPLRWFPTAVGVTETDDGSGFPKPSYALSSPNSSLLDLVGIVMGYSEFFALTDTSNTDVGGSDPARVMFDGDPFPLDNQLADGEATLHDRALGILRVALIDMDRLHADPATSVFVDDVTMAGATPTRGTTVSTTSVAYATIALRTALRTLSSQLELYSNNTPDTAILSTPLDTLPINHSSGATFSQRMKTLLLAQGNLLFDHLTDATGRAYAGWDVAANAPSDPSDTLDAHTAAIRGLFATYLATGDVKYRDRAMAVYARLDSVFYDKDARIYSTGPAPMNDVEYTPVRFALLQSALRDVYELVAARPGGEALEPVIEERVARLDKLVLNGWDDRNYNRLVDWPGECVNVVDSLPRGGLQMAERTLTGESGSVEEQIPLGGQRTTTSDREHDCVPEIDDAHLPAALADDITFHIQR
ncbi:MAG TPA: hypothetical protein VGH28_02935 [Polyangiaceae bacterium]|jgi:hypothetical protein